MEGAAPGREAPLPVLFTHFGDEWVRGSETVLLDLLRALDPARIRPVVWCNGAAMAEACAAAGHETHRSPFRFFLDAGSPRPDPRFYARLVREGRRLARAHGIRVLHANSAAPTQWLLPVARSLRLPLLAHLHIDYLRRSRHALLVHQADLIVGVSDQVLDGFLQDGVPPARTRTIYNGIDFARLDGRAGTDLRSSLGLPAGTRLVGAVGSLIRRKGHDVLLRAMARLEGAHLVLAGDGPEQAALRRLAEELGIGGRVHLLGYQAQVAGLYAGCDVVALPSHDEGLPLVLLEALALGRPVVATRVGGVPEVVADGETGLLVPPGDAAALAAALDALLTDEKARARMGAAGRARAEALFSSARMAEAFTQTYEALAAVPAAALGWGAVAGRLGPYARLLRRRSAA